MQFLLFGLLECLGIGSFVITRLVIFFFDSQYVGGALISGQQIRAVFCFEKGAQGLNAGQLTNEVIFIAEREDSRN